MQTIIEVKNLTHVYTDSENKEIKALDGINLEIRQGEFVAVIGANGSGKSTLARHFNALQRPSEGVCLIEGMDTTVEENLWDIRQHVGMVFQNPDNQIVAAIVEEDVAFGPENIGVPTAEIRTRVDAALAAVGMSDYAKHAPHLLSGGQKQHHVNADQVRQKVRLKSDNQDPLLLPRQSPRGAFVLRKAETETGWQRFQNPNPQISSRLGPAA